MTEKMSNAPVYYAMAQAQFNPVAAMVKYVDLVQDQLRREGYTLFEPQQVTHLQIAALAGQPSSEPQVTHTTSWLIAKGDRTCGFIVNPSSVTFHTTHYKRNAEFIPELLRGLRAVHEAVNLDHVARLGLRYLNAVLPKPGESIDQYLDAGMNGIRLNAQQRYALNESVFDTEVGGLLPKSTLVARVHRMTSPLGFPPDMVPNGLVQMPKFVINEPRPHAVIDTDHFCEGRAPLDFDKIGAQLSALHATIKLVFDATTTEYARAAWA